MRLINKTGLLAVALTTLLILASCSDSNTSTGVTAGRDAANLGDASGDHDGDATVDDSTGPPETDAGGGRDGDGQGSDTKVDDPTGPPVTDAGGGRDGDGQGSDTNSDAGGPKDACWDHDHVRNNGKLGRWVVGSNTYSDQEYVRKLANMNYGMNSPTFHKYITHKTAIHCVGDSATALEWQDYLQIGKDAEERETHPVTPLYYASLEKCENGKKHGGWGPIYTQACWDAGKSACYAYFLEAPAFLNTNGKWVVGNETRWRKTETGWSKRQTVLETCALFGGWRCETGSDPYVWKHQLRDSGWLCNDGNQQR